MGDDNFDPKSRAVKPRFAKPAGPDVPKDDDHAEGHGIKVRPAKPSEPNEPGNDDAEGHVLRRI